MPTAPYRPRCLSRCYNIDDLRTLAQHKLPGVVFDYIERGAEDEITVRRNRDVFQHYEFVPRVLRDVSQIDLSTRVQGIPLTLPLVLGPTGLTRLFHHQGESAVARAAHAAGLLYSLSTVSTTAIEDIPPSASTGNFFQIYVWRDKTIVADLITRCRASGYRALCLAVDTPVLGNRERDLQNGQKIPALLRANILKGALWPSRWPWLRHFLHINPLRFANLVNHFPEGARLDRAVTHINNQFSPAVTWDDVRAVQQQWGGPFIIKGIQSVADAIRAADSGATGILLSNHGGRQLDGAPAALDLLPDVVAAVGGRTEVYLDGGIRRGSDIIKAIALGARACFIGRAYLYGLAAGGEAGVTLSLQILREEMVRVMQLIGCTHLSELTPECVRQIRG